MAEELTHAVTLPHMGVSVQEATIVAWRRSIGDQVRKGETLCEVSTDKVETEIASPADGTLAEIAAAEGETVPVGTVLAQIATAQAAEPGSKPAATPALEAPPAEVVARFDAAAALEAPPAAIVTRFDAAAALAVVDRVPSSRRPLSSPVARRLAAEHAIDMAALSGSGLRGRIRKADVLAALQTRSAHRSAAPAPSGLPRGYDDVPHEILATSHARRLTAEHMIRSRQTAAHMTTEVEVDMSSALRARESLNAARVAAGRSKLTPLALIARATCAALLEFPDLNATFAGERMIRWRQVNLGIAVDTRQALMVPVIRGCEQLTTPAIAEAIAALATRARDRLLTPEDMRAGTFTISNPGSVGAHSAMAIINEPQVGILGIPAIVRRPAVVTDEHGEETIGIRPLLMLALTFDHRAIDGAYATRCLVRIGGLLESWPAAAYA